MKTLTDPLPLRTTAEWPGFRTATFLPIRIGLTRGALIQYSQDRTQWVWAGHACESVDSVFIGGLPVDNWNAANFIDAAGKPVMLVTFDAPVDEGSQPTAQGRGLLDAASGQLIENPADALIAILIDLAGIALDREAFAPFRAECARNSIFCGGSIETNDTGQTVARAIASSIGAKFSSAARTLAFIWPGGDPQPVRFTVQDDGPTLTRAAALADFCNDLTIQYDFDGSQPRGSLRLVAPAQVARYGSFPQTLAATWLTSAGVAQRVGARLLAHSARKQWLVTASGLETTALRIGDFVSFQHALLTDDGVYPVLSRSTDFEKTEITARVPIGGVPVIATASQSSFYDPNAYVSIEGTTQGDQKVWILRDTDGSTPLAGANVQILPNGVTHPTDSTGRVAFGMPSEMSAGRHYELGCTCADGRYFTFGVDV